VNLSLGPGVNPLNYRNSFVNFPTIPGGLGVVVAINYRTRIIITKRTLLCSLVSKRPW